jgi:NADP-reducing hydrogenase subunit HndC
MKYPFEKHIVVCMGKRCSHPDRGEDMGEKIQEELKDLNKKLGRKSTVRVCKVSCLDLCDYGPNLIVWPEGTVYSHLDRESAVRVYHGIMGDGPRADDKELRPEEIKKK